MTDNYDNVRGLLASLGSTLAILDNALINGDIYIISGEEVEE